MQRNNNYTIVFALVICVLCSTVISLTAVGLKSQKELNVELDRKKKILNAVGLSERVSSMKSSSDVLDLYNTSIKEVVVDGNGELVAGKTPDKLTEAEHDTLFPVFLNVKNQKVDAIAIPVEGKGLWSTLYGYLAIENDLNTVRGITFYKHGETPGLGGEIEKPWFQNNFVGKKIFGDNGELKSVSVVKGHVVDVISNERERSHYVDGISGATLTSRGVTKLLKNWLGIYEPFFKKAKSKGLTSYTPKL